MIHHGDTETRSKLRHEELTEKSLAPPSKYIARLVRVCWNLPTRNACAANCICAS